VRWGCAVHPVPSTRSFPRNSGVSHAPGSAGFPEGRSILVPVGTTPDRGSGGEGVLPSSGFLRCNAGSSMGKNQFREHAELIEPTSGSESESLSESNTTLVPNPIPIPKPIPNVTLRRAKPRLHACFPDQDDGIGMKRRPCHFQVSYLRDWALSSVGLNPTRYRSRPQSSAVTPAWRRPGARRSPGSRPGPRSRARRAGGSSRPRGACVTF